MSYSLSKKFTVSSLLMFAMPTTVMMVVMSLYTIIDGVFVSRFVGTNALSSINIVYPAINIVIGIAVMLASGSNAVIAAKMGEGRMDQAREIFSFTLAAAVVSGIVVAVLGNLFIVPLVRLLGASDALLQDCVSYLSCQLVFAPAMILQIMFQTYFVTEGRPGTGLLLTVLAGIVNAVLDYVLIVPFQMGVMGAAVATVCGYMIPAVFGLIYFAVSRRSLWIKRFRFLGKTLASSCANGSSEMVTNLSSGVITFLFNLLMMRYAGEDGVASITIIQYSQFLLNALFMGFSQGVAPVISYNFGSRNQAQLKQVFRVCLWFILASSIFVFLFSELAGGQIVGIFAAGGSRVYALARSGFTIFAVSFLFSGLNTFSSALFTALSDGKTSAVISFVRTCCLIVVSLIILPVFLGVTGVFMAIPAAELGGALLSFYYIKKYRSRYSYA